jgi:small subunit ribosomal protein S6
MTTGGVVRQFENYGETKLAYKMRKNHEWFNQGRQWTMQFDASPSAVRELNEQLKLDPLVIRHAVKAMKEASPNTLTAAT